MKQTVKEINHRRKKDFKDNLSLLKWLAFISVCLILGGTLSFTLIILSLRAIEKTFVINPVWIVGMIPLMIIVALPVTFIVYRQVTMNLNVLIYGMESVAGGDLNTYLPVAEAKDFAKVYDNFNKMVAQMRSIEVFRTEMADSLSHELKTPIASINGFAKILAEDGLSEEKRQKYTQIIINESNRLSSLVNNILLLSKLDAQEIITDKSEYNLGHQIQDCVISLENEWTAKDIDISVDLVNAVYFGSESLMKSLWLNLLNNAIKFTPKKGEINVAVSEDEQEITVKVSDNGIGMSEEAKAHIFERNYQVDKTHSVNGQGLGLSIVKRIIMLCGGSIAVESEEGAGSTFIVKLPKPQ